MLIGYARISTTDQTLVKRNPFTRWFPAARRQRPGSGWRFTRWLHRNPNPRRGFSVSNPAASEVRQSSEVPQRHRTGAEGEPERTAGQRAFMANRWGDRLSECDAV